MRDYRHDEVAREEGLLVSGCDFGKGTGTITGGTGKAAGIQGRFNINRTVVRTALEGVGQNYTKGTIKYTLP
jgi:hypothetical protein